MITILLTIFVFLFLLQATYRNENFATEDKIFRSFLTLIILFCVMPVPLNFEGLNPNYGSGVAEGYILSLSEEGVFYKTWEGTLKLSNNDASSAPTVKITAGTKNIADKMNAAFGKKIRISWKKWLVMPWSVGSSGNEIIDVEVLE